ncbi:MAG: hypothetical protein HPY82_20015 [Gammaproteobacteria bacterium]|nr:hypothetical protein [Gammaproteobacteria bacterium]
MPTSERFQIRFFEWGVLLTLYGVYIVFNLLVSEMNFGGLAVNSAAIGILLVLFWTRDFAFVGLFFALNFLLGPFLIINLVDIDLPNVGRMDYFLAVLIAFFGILNRGYISKVSLTSLSIIAGLIVWGGLIKSQQVFSILEYFDTWYGILGKLSSGILLFLLLKRREVTNCENAVGQMIFFLLSAHLVVAWIQFFIPVSFRSGTIEAGLSIAGFKLNRPVGLLEASYVFGVVTIGVWYLGYRLSNVLWRKYYLILLIAILPVALVSVRSAAIGVALFMLLFLWPRVNRVVRSIVLVSGFSLGVWLAVQGMSIIAFADQSNATKLLLWWTAIYKWISDFPSWASFFGYGSDSASYLVQGGGFFDIASDLGANYDNRIDGEAVQEGFPIHNVFVQFFFEYGLFPTILATILMWRGFKNTAAARIELPAVFAWCIVVTNFFFHNGIFSPWLTALILLVAFSPGLTVFARGASFSERNMAKQVMNL